MSRFVFRNLDEVREYMLAEINEDILSNRLYLSSRLTDAGKAEFGRNILDAAGYYDNEWLAGRLNGKFNTVETRAHPTKGWIDAKVPVNAPKVLADNEFNRYYMRAVCRKALQDGSKVHIYRARESSRPRPEHERLIGLELDPGMVPTSLTIGDNELLTPGCGLSLEIIK